MAKKSTVNKAGNYTKPEMRKRIFNRIKAGGKGGNPGQWSARKAQMLAKAYKSAGGGYKEEGGKIMSKYESGGKAESQRSLDQWTGEEWDNVSGKKGDRYLPKKVRQGMSSGQKAAENRKKRKATKSGRQIAKYSDSLKKSMRSKGVYKKGGKTFKPHMMYKGNKSVKANTYEEHLSLNKKGYGHTKKKELGGKLNGPSHDKGGIPIEVEGGEYIIKKKSVNSKTEPVLEYINENGKLPSKNEFNYPITDARNRSKE